jgi:response regulator RpfG family c-di-GMP phosphodiesterase
MAAGPTYPIMTAAAGSDGPVVYVVDDDKAIRLALSTLLRSVGLRVETFESPEDFLQSGSVEKAESLFTRKSSTAACACPSFS